MATHALSRRGFLGHVAGAYTATALVAGAGAGVTLAMLIDRYADANEAMGEASNRADLDPCEANDAEFKARQTAYDAALLALLGHRPATLDEAGQRFAFLYSRSGPWEACLPEEWEVRTVAQSMMQGARA